MLMKIAAVADIHGNHRALEACLDHIEAQKIKHVLFLGDYITDCPGVRETLDMIYQARERFNTYFIRGNREEYMLDYDKSSEKNWTYGSKNGSLLYTYERLTRDDLSFFEELPNQKRISIDGFPEFEVCHGSFRASRCMAFPDHPDMNILFEDMKTGLLFCAHTHTQFVCKRDNKIVVNGGAVGIPTHGSTDAEMIIVEYKNEKWIPELVKLKYDISALEKDFYQSGFAEKANIWARAVLKTLKEAHPFTLDCIALVGEYSKESGLPLTDETLWEKAAQKLCL